MDTLKSGLLAIAAVLSACNPSELEPVDSTELAQTQSNGMELNGLQLNGYNFNGLQLNGYNFNGLQLNGYNFNGTQLSSLSISGSQLSAYQGSNLLTGSALVGSVLNIAVGTGPQVKVKFNAIYADPQSSSGDVYLYDAVYQTAGTSTWTSVCKDESGNAVPAIPVANYWDMRTGDRIDNASVMTLACVNGAIGKCVRWGYRPWATANRCTGGTCSAVSLKDYHQACTRMVRADYCGDGTGNTVNGTPIDVYDGLSPQIQSPASTWQVEAHWTPAGATCLGNTRGADLLARFRYPDCKTGNKYNERNPFPACANNYTVTAPDLLGDNYNHVP